MYVCMLCTSHAHLSIIGEKQYVCMLSTSHAHLLIIPNGPVMHKHTITLKRTRLEPYSIQYNYT